MRRIFSVDVSGCVTKECTRYTKWGEKCEYIKKYTPMINRCSPLKDDIHNGDVPTFDSNSATTGRPMRVRRPPELYGMTDFYQSYVKSADYDRLLKPPVQLYPESHSDR